MASPIQEWYAQNIPRSEVDMDPAEKERCAFIDRQLSSAESARMPFLQQASVGIAQYNTETQWAEWDNQSRRMADRPAQAWQKRVTVNVTSGVVDVVAATLTNNQPGWEVTPAHHPEAPPPRLPGARRPRPGAGLRLVLRRGGQPRPVHGE